MVLLKNELCSGIYVGSKYFGSNSKCMKRLSGIDHINAEFPSKKADASSINKKELQKRESFVINVAGYIASSTSKDNETNLLLGHLVKQ